VKLKLDPDDINQSRKRINNQNNNAEKKEFTDQYFNSKSKDKKSILNLLLPDEENNENNNIKIPPILTQVSNNPIKSSRTNDLVNLGSSINLNDYSKSNSR